MKITNNNKEKISKNSNCGKNLNMETVIYQVKTVSNKEEENLCYVLNALYLLSSNLLISYIEKRVNLDRINRKRLVLN